MADVTIAILTYNRPDGLRQTLTSCLSQGARLGLEIDILVIDNHPSGNGQSVVAAFDASGANIRYMPDLSRNMSALRNLGFSEAKANLVAFIDDDEVADGNWIDELVGTLRATGAAIAVGPRRALFASGSPPAYDPTGAGFTRDINLPDQADIALVNLNGKPLYGLGTGNSIFDVEKCFGNGEAMMRLEFGNAGGEDAELFTRLYRKGRKIAWAAKAIVTETVLENRTHIAYRMIRTRREAQHYVTIYLDGSPQRRKTYAELILKGLIQVVTGGMLGLLSLEFFSRRRIGFRLLLANGLGKLSWRQPIGYISE